MKDPSALNITTDTKRYKDGRWLMMHYRVTRDGCYIYTIYVGNTGPTRTVRMYVGEDCLSQVEVSTNATVTWLHAVGMPIYYKRKPTFRWVK